VQIEDEKIRQWAAQAVIYTWKGNYKATFLVIGLCKKSSVWYKQPFSGYARGKITTDQ
jgi:hypothetical protein